MDQEKKYELTEDTGVILDVDAITLHRIRALRDFGNVKAGEMGGWVESEKNLDQYGNAWVDGNAVVYGDAMVYGEAMVYGDACVHGRAHICGYAHVSEHAEISGNACYNWVGPGKFTASELCRCPNLSYNEDVLRERGIA